MLRVRTESHRRHHREPWPPRDLLPPNRCGSSQPKASSTLGLWVPLSSLLRGAGLPLVPPLASLPIFPLPSASFPKTCPSPAHSSGNERRHNPPSTHFFYLPPTWCPLSSHQSEVTSESHSQPSLPSFTSTTAVWFYPHHCPGSAPAKVTVSSLWPRQISPF